MPELCLLCVHAHPDDESSKGAGTVARYHAEGVKTVLVTCTGGEEGDVLNPAVDSPEVRERLPEIRLEELERAAKVIGYDEVVLLGYRDSGMPGSESNNDPRSFAMAPLEEATRRLVEVIRRVRPQVVVTYPRDQRGYLHPDHLRVNEVSEAAFEAAGDPARYPEAGPAWQPLRLYYVMWSFARIKALHEKFLELGLESPFKERIERAEEERRNKAEQGDGPPEDGLPLTTVCTSGYGWVRRQALLSHETQVDPSSPFWFGLPPEVDEEIFPYEEYRLARDLSGVPDGGDDLFGGLRHEGAGDQGATNGGAGAPVDHRV